MSLSAIEEQEANQFAIELLMSAYIVLKPPDPHVLDDEGRPLQPWASGKDFACTLSAALVRAAQPVTMTQARQIPATTRAFAATRSDALSGNRATCRQARLSVPEHPPSDRPGL